jgi:hypothetical protein
MGMKNDAVIAHLGARIGELSRRCRTLATMCNTLNDEKTAALARVREVEDTHRLQVRLLDSQNAELEEAAQGRRRLQADNERLRVAAMGDRETLAQRAQEIDRLRAQLAQYVPGGSRYQQASQWPGVTDVDWTVGLDYISPHLTGSWKLVEVRSDQLLRLTRQGAPDGHVRPDILADMDNNLCLSEGPF